MMMNKKAVLSVLCLLCPSVTSFSSTLVTPATKGLHKPTSTSLNVVEEKIAPLYGEESRKYRRTAYTHDNWPYHRSPDRIFRNLGSIFKSGIVSQLKNEVGLVISVASGIFLWNNFIAEGFTDLNGVYHDALLHNVLPALKLPQTPFTLASPALGLLLVFKTNNAYDRWWEARKLWGTIVNHTRNICRMTSAYESEEATLERLALAVWSFPRSLTRHLLGDEDVEDYNNWAMTELDEKYARDLIEARHKPTRALFEITRCLKDLPMNDYVRMEVDRSATTLCDAMGACERIFSTPIPLVYTRHTARFLTVWLLFLPFCLWEPFNSTWNHIGMIPASLFISFFLFGIEELAMQVEEPFSILPLHVMTNNIGLSCKDYVVWRDELPEEAKILPKPKNWEDIINVNPQMNPPY